MAILDDVLAQPIGARFYRADLHIHSFGGSHDVKDAGMTAQAIVAAAAQEGLSLIAITDHNEIANVEAAILASSQHDILVIPGVELSTPQGHLLCYVPSIEALQKLHGQLSIVDRGTQTSRCQNSITECLNLLAPLHGFAILAHVDASSGFDVEVPGASPHKADVVCHPSLLGLELKQASSVISYSDTDPDNDRARIGQERIARLNLGAKQFLARVLNSDAHTLAALGRNAQNVRKVTRYKMDEPTFDALRVALEDSDARVRIEDQIPTSVPRVVGLHMTGGFLSGQVIQFGPNLNCIIGGRGAGKSTTFEAVRCLIKDGSECSKVVDSDAWPDDLYLFWQDRAGQYHTLYRQKDAELVNVDDPELGPCSFEVDCFGQGEAAKIGIQSQTDPLALLRYLDRFVDIGEDANEEALSRETLLKLQTEIEKAEQQVALIPQFERLLETTRKQLGALQKDDVKEVIELQRRIATERQVRTSIQGKLRVTKTETERLAVRTSLEEIRDIAKPSSLALGSDELEAIIAGLTTFETTVGAGEAQIKAGLTAFEQVVTAQVKSWLDKENKAQQQIDTKRKELEALNISLDMSYITKLAKDEADYQQSLNNLKTWKPHLASLRKQRAIVLEKRWKSRERIGMHRDAFGKTASATLREALSDIQVTLKYSRSAYSPEASNLIIEAMAWRTNQQPRANYLVEKLTIPKLLDCIAKGDTAPLTSIKTAEGVQVFNTNEAKAILEKLGEPAMKFALERVQLHDLPRLTLTRERVDASGNKQYIQREFAQLSLGQQQSVLLALILSADSDRPLIIDQPEDNLDGQFIYSTLVPVLRRAKERRQVIIVTHNANVAILGDAEQILVLRAFNDRGKLANRGSIDNLPTREAACAILEGSRDAFLRRARMYGVRLQ